MAEEEEQNPVDQLVDLFVYAPVGLLYEYQDVIPKLVKRGKSQVQIARVIGKMAVNRSGPGDALTELAGGVASLLGRQITEIGTAMGLVPPDAPGDNDDRDRPSSGVVPPPPGPPPPPPSPELTDGSGKSHASDESDAPVSTDDPVGRLPIARYDELKAKEIIPLLSDLDPDQQARIRAHEEANRARKTVLGKLDRLSR